ADALEAGDAPPVKLERVAGENIPEGEGLEDGVSIRDDGRPVKEKKVPVPKVPKEKVSFKVGMANNKKHHQKLYKAMQGMIAAAVLIFIGVGILFLVYVLSPEDDGIHHIGSPSHVFNHANHAFVNIPVVFGEEHVLNLHQILFDVAATVFYFEGELDLSQYAFRLEGPEGRSYAHEIAFTVNHDRQRALNRTPVRFEPIDPYGESLILTITYLRTRDEYTIEMAYTEYSINQGRFFTEASRIDDASTRGLTVSLNHAHFSASGSSIALGIHHNFTDGGIRFEHAADGDSITLRHRVSFIPAVTGDIQMVDFEGANSHLARMDFGPLTTLLGDVEIFINGLHRVYDTPITVPGSAILTPGPPREYVIELGSEHRVTIRGMARQGNIFVMPLFGERPRAYRTHDAYGRLTMQDVRVATTMNVSLVGTDIHGYEQRIVGRVNFDHRGTDVIFDTRLNPYFDYVPNATLRVEIEDISVRLPQMVYTLNLNYGEYYIAHDPATERVIDALTRHFSPHRAQVSVLEIRNNEVFAMVMQLQGNTMLENAVHGTLGANGQLEILSIQTIEVDRLYE
ncbi:MAG: hypothetical protein FWB74_03225, partial [Defluviitaleaceae bacterium]|nr:hypothetical protein [Defluviitaleaceae bacterium]